jgi:superfamily II DNA or RNA helicase
MTETLDIDWEAAVAVPHRFALRGQQPEWLASIIKDFETKSRLLVVAPGGVGKTTLFAALAAHFHALGIRTLVLENRDRLTRQTADRIRTETGIDVDIEMGDDHASPFAPIVVASVQTLGRVNRLTGFSESHFGLIVADECHFALSPGWQRVLCYFHYGAHSLDADWKRPPDGSYEPKAKCAGFTATPDIGERKNLGEFFHHRSVNYSYLEAVQDGWLVGPVQKNIPVRIDLSKYKAKSTPNGNDFAASDLSAALIPIIEELAEQILIHANTKKTIAFLPSVECARMMTDALLRRGMRAIFVSGECLDASEKTDEFAALGAGSVLVNCCLYVYGVDFPDVDCIAWFRATISKAFYIQGIYRGTRVLPGILNGLKTAEERRAAIAQSSKPFLTILDPLFVSDRIDLLDAYDLLTDEPRVKAAMKASGELSVESAQQAERDFLKSLKKEAKKHERKAARTIDPLAFAVSLGDTAIRSYEPREAWESQPASVGQLDFIRHQGMDISGITSKGLASRIISRLRVRQDNRLASPRQLKLLHQLGLDEQTCAVLTITEATATIDRMLAARRAVGVSAA